MRKEKQVVDVNVMRADNYQSHLKYKAFVHTLPIYKNVLPYVGALLRPRLGLFGNTEFETESQEYGGTFFFDGAYWLLPESYYRLAQTFDLHEPGCLAYWYWTPEGWAELERQWSQLPEVVHIPLCTTRGVVHLRTQVEYSYPSDRQ